MSKDIWSGFKMFLVFRDAEGDWFPSGDPKYIGFNKDNLVGYFDTDNECSKAFLKGDVYEPRIKLIDYKGLSEDIKKSLKERENDL